MEIKLNFILLNTLVLILISIIVYNFRQNNINLPRLENNIRKKEFKILKSIGISFLILIPIIFIQILNNKEKVKIGISSPIKI
tara:strand:- start:254 stop:502 length:249 start_codon:yes stop_codon:yes gene_type:complete